MANFFQRGIDRIRIGLGRTLVKTMALPLVPKWAVYSFLQPTFKALVREGYQANAVVFACISTHVFAFPEPPLRVWRNSKSGGREGVANHPIELLFNKPNEDMGAARFWQYVITYLAIGGNCYGYKVRSQSKKVVEVWPLNDAQLRPVAGGDRFISHYEIIDDTGKMSDEEKRIPKEDIIHWMWLPDPLQPWRGQSPLKAMASDIDTDNELDRYIFALLKNLAVPPIALKFPNVLDDEVFNRLRSQWEDHYGGENRGKPALLEAGIDVEKIGFDLNQLAFEALRNVPEARISAALRVPAVIVGLLVGLQNATYSNVQGMHVYYTQRTLVPLWRAVGDQVGASLLDEFGGAKDLTVAFDLSQVAALVEANAAQRTWALEAFRAAGITRNEFRAEIGKPRVAGGDVFLQSAALVEAEAQLEASNVKHDASNVKRETSSGYSAKTTEKATQRRRAAERVIERRRKMLNQIAPKMEKDVRSYFEKLSDSVAKRLREQLKRETRDERREAKAAPTAERLVTGEDDVELEKVWKRWVVNLLEVSWDSWNAELGVEVAFDLTDPAVNRVLAYAGERIKDINETTRAELADVLQYGERNGWSIDDFIRGDPDNGIPGIKDVIVETYKGRHETIARTELGFAQNTATTGRYSGAGVEKVFVLDNGLSDDDAPCVAANGAVWTLEKAEQEPLEHPRCTRAFAAWFED